MKGETMISYLIVAAFCFVIGYQQAALKHRDLQASIRQQKNLAAERLAELNAERDRKQALLDKAAKEQEDRDREAKNEIERLAGELADRPVRVRYVTTAGKCDSGQSESGGTAPAVPGAGSAAPSYGVLPEPNSRRLGIALKKVETLSAAYNSCRATLLRDHTNTDALGGN